MAQPGYFISTTIPYVNARPHIGHVLEYVQTDCFARWHRLLGDDVFLLTGSDENSLKNVLAAEQEGLPVLDFVTRNVGYFTDLKDGLNLSYDYFIRTSTDPLHADGAAKMWRALDARGDIYTRRYEGLYCVGCEQFYTPDELDDGLCPDHGTRPDLVQEENYFFRLSRYAQPILDAIESGRMEIVPAGRRNEVITFLRGEVRDISISRSHARAHGWGMPVPGDDTQVMYVWIDALTNYINAIDYANEGDLWKRYWVDARARVHALGKGVIRFHAVYWPAMLLAAGIPLPTLLFVHEYITIGGGKMSKSRGMQVDPAELVARYGTDAVRHFLLAEMPMTQDLDFTEERLIDRYNTDLANGLGNLLNRTVNMIVKYRDGVIPRPEPDDALDRELIAVAGSAHSGVAEAMRRYDHRQALESLWELVRRGNKYIEESAPWKLAAAHDDVAAQRRLESVLHNVAEALRHIALELRAFIPGTADAILGQLGSALAGPANDDTSWGSNLSGSKVRPPEPIFPRIVDPPRLGGDA